ncbi:bifunctional ADP-dependent NAD(P)H-hydrate dehydratase/NAD(P)H-hydrate epimerase [Dietzia sp. ANT_WB102]|uniref:bifunctional ADP-dependent NAD(P)H-hydrate dehydratase/NAD(P)H-hydrate epimerase n=1 Tax=Dietzia sp. ANT_WB102 TaxID=2597345 RepID=UPI0011EF3CF9|nr:bifunctional ADP-dependent NAD(P)H-hydrate dehydratase/NAD(P)H-hydrate epimerase [Dietzia sp. ANT_WB102]KAA0916942.1 bifunctional ADP-dependent NAD(P)H-hydrate dehydratase/NAD(P)H-hydrate epimerase [Dietzia sp. ANT_WB102]
MRCAYPVEVIREAERPLLSATEASGDPDAVMRRAAAGVAYHTAVFLREITGGVYGRSVLLVVGSGDNGGDALYTGAALRRRGCRVEAVLTDPGRAHPRALAALRQAGGRIVPAGEVCASGRRVPDVAVDGVVGLAGTGPLREPAAEVVARLRAAGVPLIAVDLPSGVDADTGTVHEPHVQAALTVTFGVLRRAHLLASPVCGRVEVVDIGLADLPAGPGTITRPGSAEVGRAWPVPGPADDKYTQGVVAVRAGSDRYPGAAVLCASAAVAATSGMVRYVGSGAAAVLAVRPEVVCHPTVAETGTAQAWVVGPGGGTGTDAVADIDAVLAKGRPTVLDADALTCVAAHPVLLRSATAPILLTPHAGEFDRLTGGWDRADRPGALRRFTAGLRDRGIEATVLLKGRVTMVDDGETTFAVDVGSSWAATAGSGDVLSGMVGALLASGAATGGAVAWAAVAAATAHGEAARRAAHRQGAAGAPIGASDLVAAVPRAISALRGPHIAHRPSSLAELPEWAQ